MQMIYQNTKDFLSFILFNKYNSKKLDITKTDKTIKIKSDRFEGEIIKLSTIQGFLFIFSIPFILVSLFFPQNSSILSFATAYLFYLMTTFLITKDKQQFENKTIFSLLILFASIIIFNLINIIQELNPDKFSFSKEYLIYYIPLLSSFFLKVISWILSFYIISNQARMFYSKVYKNTYFLKNKKVFFMPEPKPITPKQMNIFILISILIIIAINKVI